LVPAFYLAAFTGTGERDGFVTVSNLERRRQYRGRPDEVAFRNNYNTLQSADVDPDALEQAFAQVEQVAAPAIRRVLDTASAPEGDDLHAVLMLLAIQIARAPSHRESIARFTAEVSQRMLETVTSSPDIFESYAARMRANGIDMGDYQEMHDFVRRSQVVVADSDWLKAMSLEALDVVVDTMLGRAWSILTIPGDADYSFVTSEHPLRLGWTKNELAGGFYPPGFGLPDTRVTFPLGPRVMLWGEFGGPSRLTVEVDEHLAGLLNSSTIYGSLEIYSTDAEFLWADGQTTHRGFDAFIRGLDADVSASSDDPTADE
jgi:hypothetical protein